MGYLLGTDEAGYGPNLGPLVISATVWEAPEDVGPEDFYDRLAGVIAPSPRGASGGDGLPLVLADSKKLYQSGGTRRPLERGRRAMLGLPGHCPRTWRDAWKTLAPEALERMPSIPWYADYDASAPLDCDASEIEPLVPLLRAGLEAAGVRLIAVRSRAIFTGEFNELLARHETKGSALSRETLDLAARAIEPLPRGPIQLVCDKHGGRNRYAPLLAERFDVGLLEVGLEGRERSVYRFGPPERRIEVCFRAKAEACLPAALASMASKYLRELAMRAFNAFWSRRVPGLQPTAGYPLDARRFRADVAESLHRMHLDERIFWRAR